MRKVPRPTNYIEVSSFRARLPYLQPTRGPGSHLFGTQHISMYQTIPGHFVFALWNCLTFSMSPLQFFETKQLLFYHSAWNWFLSQQKEKFWYKTNYILKMFFNIWANLALFVNLYKKRGSQHLKGWAGMLYSSGSQTGVHKSLLGDPELSIKS